eukprot:12524_1
MAVTQIQSNEEFESCVKKAAGGLVLVDFFATWCGPCVMIAPKLKEMAKGKYSDVAFYKVDVDALGEIAQEMGITAMPTFKLFRDGVMLGEMRGADQNGIEALLMKHGGGSGGASKAKAAPAAVEKAPTEEKTAEVASKPAAKTGGVVPIGTEDDFGSKVLKAKSDQLVVVDFHAQWCGPCKKIAPQIDEFSRKYADVEFYKVDIDDLESVAMSQKIQAMPTFKLYKNGQMVAEFTGASPASVEKLIQKHRTA